MARNLQVLLVENVDGTGIVGDVVHVRKGFARNFLLPRGIATTPDEGKIKELQGKRKEAIKALGELKKSRAALIEKLKGQTITMIRSCNDLGILYGAVTQHEIAVELAKAGFKGVIDREVRIALPIKRIGDYSVTVKFSDITVPDEAVVKATTRAAKRDEVVLEAEIKVIVKPDRELDIDRGRADAEAAESATIEKKSKDKGAVFATDKPADKKADAAPAADAPAKQAGKPAKK